MKTTLFLLVLGFWATEGVGQTSIGFVLSTNAYTSDQSILNSGATQTLNLGLSLKKSLAIELNLVSGISYRRFEIDFNELAQNRSFQSSYFRFFTSPNGPKGYIYGEDGLLHFNYLSIPIGLEYKVTSFLRLQYNLENNFFLKSSDDTNEQIQFGENSISKFMISQSAYLLLHSGAFGTGFGVSFHPSIFSKDLTYSYAFMNDLVELSKSSYSFNIVIWFDLKFIKKRKIL